MRSKRTKTQSCLKVCVDQREIESVGSTKYARESESSFEDEV